MVQLGFYFHMQQALGSSRIALTWPLLFTVCFMLVFSIVIALFKDIPDVKGDSQVSRYLVQAFSQLTQTCRSRTCMLHPTKDPEPNPACPVCCEGSADNPLLLCGCVSTRSMQC